VVFDSQADADEAAAAANHITGLMADEDPQSEEEMEAPVLPGEEAAGMSTPALVTLNTDSVTTTTATDVDIVAAVAARIFADRAALKTANEDEGDEDSASHHDLFADCTHPSATNAGALSATNLSGQQSNKSQTVSKTVSKVGPLSRMSLPSTPSGSGPPPTGGTPLSASSTMSKSSSKMNKKPMAARKLSTTPKVSSRKMSRQESSSDGTSSDSTDVSFTIVRLSQDSFGTLLICFFKTPL